MTYSESLAYIHSAPRFKGTAGLARIRRLCELLGNPQRTPRFVHVAGTNGKGSIAHMIAASLMAGGYRTGLFISPYVLDFRERIQINGERIPKEAFAQIASRVREADRMLAEEGMNATEFELVTACGLLWMKDCDFVVLEVGIGGRFDATNVIDAPDCAVIAKIALDHTAILGDSVEQIAFEKCGIIKGAHEVVSYPDQPSGALRVIREQCAGKGAHLCLPREDAAEDVQVSLSECAFTYDGLRWKIPLGGAHQVKNALTALSAVEALRRAGVNIPKEAARDGIARISYPGRLERISDDPLIYLDGAHNPDGAQALFRALEGIEHTIIFGAMRDKDYPAAAQLLQKGAKRFIACGMPQLERAAPPEEICQAVGGCETAACAADALELLKKTLPKGEAAVFCGSLYLVSEVRGLLRKE